MPQPPPPPPVGEAGTFAGGEAGCVDDIASFFSEKGKFVSEFRESKKNGNFVKEKEETSSRFFSLHLAPLFFSSRGQRVECASLSLPALNKRIDLSLRSLCHSSTTLVESRRERREAFFSLRTKRGDNLFVPRRRPANLPRRKKKKDAATSQVVAVPRRDAFSSERQVPRSG